MKTDPAARGMPVVAALQALIDRRRDDQIVITNQASARVWPMLSQHPLDFHYNPSTMGGAIPLALGLAIADPKRQVLVVSGDGSLLMSLGALVTVVGARATNLTVVVLNNRMYEVTGGQKTPATETDVDLPAIATAAGFSTALAFDDLSEWRARAEGVFALPGPRFVSLQVQPTPKEYLAGVTPSMAEQLTRLRGALRSGGHK
jgi:thiamine pyrophosphate-dependent acetolactate synthase large subunit-like protein